MKENGLDGLVQTSGGTDAQEESMDFGWHLADGVLAEESPGKGSQAGRGGDTSGLFEEMESANAEGKARDAGRQKEQESGPAALKGLHAPGRYFNQRAPSRLLPFSRSPPAGGGLAPPEAHTPSWVVPTPTPRPVGSSPGILNKGGRKLEQEWMDGS